MLDADKDEMQPTVEAKYPVELKLLQQLLETIELLMCVVVVVVVGDVEDFEQSVQFWQQSVDDST